MPKTLNLKVEKDHLVSLTRVSSLKALKELIWNSLDADSEKIEISLDTDGLGSIKGIRVKDNGHGIQHSEALEAFSKLGGSAKKRKKLSPENRILHGEEGKGRFRVFALGGLITFVSVYLDGKKKKSFRIKLDINALKNPIVEDPKDVQDDIETGVQVIIENVQEKITEGTFGLATRNKISQTYAVYHEAYDFNILIEGEKIDFESVVKKVEKKSFKVDRDGEVIDFIGKIIEWNFETDTDLYLCDLSGIAYQETNLGYKPSIPVTVYLMSDYIEKLQKESRLNLDDLDEMLLAAKTEVRNFAKDYVRERKHQSAKQIIQKLKEEQLYPYKEDPKTPTERAERQVFDIVTLEVHESLSDFEDQPHKSKKLTLQLLKEALGNDKSDFRKILKEIVELPKDKVSELSEILESTSLTSVIDAMKEIQDRIRTIYELRELLFNTNYKDKVLERRHLHKIVANETWIFGDDFTYGADDITLRNVLKAYLSSLGRDSFIEKVQGDGGLDRHIPDVCLWKQYNKGKSGHFKNLVIELKRPNKSITPKEIQQIKNYAKQVHSDERFPKDRTEWVFILLSTSLNEDAEFECDQDDREWGHVVSKEGLDVYVMRWGDLLNQADSRHQFLKEKLGYEISEEDEGIILLNKKYQEYLPDEIKDTGS